MIRINYLVVIAVIISSEINCIESRLEPTKLVSGQIFKLQNQHDGRFLTADSNGQYSRREYSGSGSQKFLFTLVEGKDIWTLTPQDDSNSNRIHYQVAYVGHGKYQFTNLSTNLCLQASGAQEARCDKNEPKLRWFVDTVSSSDS